MRSRVMAGLLALLLALGGAGGACREEEQEGPAVWLPSDEPEETWEGLPEAQSPLPEGTPPAVQAPCAILMEAATGTVLFEKEADTKTEPASVTKLMTMLLVAEAVEAGRLALSEPVTVSAHAAGLGGSQIFLAQGEVMEAGELLKAMAVASANDAAAALAEHLCGSEESFVALMNRRAAELGMTNTVYANCSGLDPAGEHLTTARDVALLSRAVLTHRWLREYTTIWTDTVRGGAFGLSNTNKLIRWYPGATGLKTGFTARAGFCVAATAQRDGMEVIAVVLRGESSAARFSDAAALMDYAFAGWTLLDPAAGSPLPPLPVKLGSRGLVQPVLGDTAPLLVPKALAGSAERTLSLPESVTAPVAAGQELGTLTLTAGGRLLGEIPLAAAEAVPRLTWRQVFWALLRQTVTGR